MSKVIFETKFGASDFEYKLGEVNIAKILKWLVRWYTIYDIELPENTEVVDCLSNSSPHVACMIIGPQKRNINGDSKNAKDRYLVAIRWNYLKEDIINFKNKASTTNIN